MSRGETEAEKSAGDVKLDDDDGKREREEDGGRLGDIRVRVKFRDV